MADIFLSYRRTDRDRVEPIAALLEARGWSVWWDTRIDAGERWDEVVEREVGAASCVVAVWSFESVCSRWVRAEASEGLERGVLVPVLIDATKLPLEFRRVHCIDLTGWKGGAEEPPAKALVCAVAKLLGQAYAGHAAAEPQPHRNLLKRLRAYSRRAALLTGRGATAAKAGIVALALCTQRVNARTVLATLVAALILAVLPGLWLTGWLDAAWQARKPASTQRPEVEVVLELAQWHIANGDVKEARRVLSAYEGVAPGRIALALGETYDPNMLAAWGARGVLPDADKARSLYRKAQRLRVQGVNVRLDNLSPAEGGGVWTAHPPAPLLSNEDWARAHRVLEQSTKFQKDGNVAAARNGFQYVYHMGLAAGALKMAETFDPHELRRQGPSSIAPDPGEARHWYELARGMGHPEAGKRLQRLAAAAEQQ
jgi:hypothetical protein